MFGEEKLDMTKKNKISKLFYKLFCMAGIFVLLIHLWASPAQVVFAKTKVPAQKEVYDAMISMKSRYPERTPWTNANYSAFHGGIYSGGYGCAGFAFMLSDKAFGKLPAMIFYAGEFEYGDIRAGDILRVNKNTHSVIVLEAREDSVVIAEGNYTSSVHWGRVLTKTEVLAADYLMTRYPASVKIVPKKIKMKTGESKKIAISAQPSGMAKMLVWESSNPQAVKVTKTGKVKAKAAGTAVITAKTSGGISVSCKIAVKDGRTAD